MGKDCKKFVSWRRISTDKQGARGLGMRAQEGIINHFVEQEGGGLIADFAEVYTGKDLVRCAELRKAIDLCKREGATLVIAKTDRFRNTVEALQIFEELGGNIYFCDLPHTDKFTLTLFFALAEREALLVSIRTKQALAAKRASGWNPHRDNTKSLKLANAASAKVRRMAALNDETNKLLWQLCRQNLTPGNDAPGTEDFRKAADILGSMGKTTPRGCTYTTATVRQAYNRLNAMYAEAKAV